MLIASTFSALKELDIALRFADCEFDTDRRELWRAGESVHVEPQVFELLAYLIGNNERVVGKDELLAAVWGAHRLRVRHDHAHQRGAFGGW